MILHPQSSHAVIIDPGQAQPVIDVIKRNNLTLVAILITHHHWDHTQGVSDLVRLFNIPVYGPCSIPCVSHPVKERTVIELDQLNCSLRVIEIPGHTLDHIAYLTHQAVFCGDTLFTAGCGRVFEGTSAQMYHSLQKLARLPASTQIYCGHEYTEANLRFAKILEPENSEIQKRILYVHNRRKDQNPTVPAPLSLELKTNPFLRCEKKSVLDAIYRRLGHHITDPIDIFTEIRSWKDHF